MLLVERSGDLSFLGEEKERAPLKCSWFGYLQVAMAQVLSQGSGSGVGDIID
jgi:hypothetical protein